MTDSSSALPSQLSPQEKRALLARLIRERTQPAFPLSHGQHGIWLEAQRDLQSAALNIGFAATVSTPLDGLALRRTAQKLAERHPALRTTFELRRGEVLQVIHPAEELAVEELDVVGWSDDEVRQRVEEEFHRPFDLVRGPLIRTVLFHRGDDREVLLIVLHHLIGDFWSLVLLAEEWPALYRSEQLGIPVDLPAPTASYAEFVSWQQKLLDGPDGARMAEFWKSESAGVPPILDWPTDFSRPPRLAHRGALHPVRLNRQLTESLRLLSRRSNVTLYSVLMASFQLLTGRTANQDSFFVGSPFVGRSRSEFTRVVGYFSNMLPVQADLSGNPTVTEFLQRVGRICLRVMAHQDYPFPLIVQAADVPRDAGRTPLFQTTFTLEKSHGSQAIGAAGFMAHAAPSARSFGELKLKPFPFAQRTSQADLSLLLEDAPDELAGFFRYNTDLFAAETIARWAERWERILTSFVDQPDQHIDEIPLLTPNESRLIETWSTGPIRPRENLTLSRMVSRQAAETPSATAIVDENRRWTYAELDAAANRIAGQLSRDGVGPGSAVAICLPRSAEFIAALLGVLKTGAAYSPLNPFDPAERLQDLLTELQADVAITDESQEQRLESFAGNRLRLGHELEICTLQPEEPFVDGSAPDGVAYVIFTSGSTGRPKGVAVEHRAISNTVAWRNEEFPLTSDDSVLLTFACVFDPWIVAIVSTLSAGATLVIPPDHVERDSARLALWLNRRPITVLQMTPSQLRLCLEAGDERAGAAVRLIICGGEVMPPDLPQRLADRFGFSAQTDGQPPELRIVNLYGPTECACDVCDWVCEPISTPARVPIGRPVANITARVLDARGRLAAIGVPGELCIGGIGLARGYWNDAERTAALFIRRPADGHAVERLYRTGDLVRWRNDGTLDFLGRIDQQIKLRGHRIEPSEIEHLLRVHPEVRDATVFVAEIDGRQRLAAVLIGDEIEHPTVEELRRLVRRKLPEHMTPTAWGWTAHFPMTASGKLDHRALVSLLGLHERVEATHPPQSPLETYLAEQFCRVLTIPEVGRNQDFFELGGGSIDAALLVNELQQKLGEYVYTVAVYDAPRISELACYLAEMYPDAVERLFGPESLPADTERAVSTIDENSLAEFCRLIRVLPPRVQKESASSRNPPLALLLSAPRSGSTLARAMLGGHPQIFAPPELQLLNFNTLRDRRAAFASERDRFWLGGTVRALMQLLSCDVDSARDLMEQCEREELAVKEFYRFLQDRLGERWFLDKTPMYALDPAVLQRAEEDFQEPRYIHLVRHPAAVQASFVKARLQVFFQPFLRGPNRFAPAEFAELVWTLSQRTILDFLETIPAERQLRIHFEILVRDPREEMERVTQFLGLSFDPAMLEPQADPKFRMTDPVDPLARMLGDVRFFEHQGVDANAADRWRQESANIDIGEPTWQIAERLGYERTSVKTRGRAVAGRHLSHRDLLVPLQTDGASAPMIWIHPPGGIVICYHALAKLLGPDRPVFAARARGAHGEAVPHDTVEEMAAAYADEIIAACPEGELHLGGWSAGGVIAIEVARQLRERGRQVGVIALLDSSVPVGTSDYPDDVSGLPPAVEFGLDISLIELARLEPARQLDYILNHARQIGVIKPDTPMHLVKDTAENLGRMFHTHVQAVQRYRVPTPIDGLVLFRPEESVAADEGRSEKGWGDFGAVDIRIVPGNHYSMVKEPHVRNLAEQLRDVLRRSPSS